MRKILFSSAIVVFVLILILLLKPRLVGDNRQSLLPAEKKTDQVGEAPEFPVKLPQGLKIGVFASNLGKVRDLEFSPGNTLIASIISTGRIVALPDKNQDGRVDEVKEILKGLDNPHGLAFYQGKLFVAEETQMVRYFWDEKNMEAQADKILFPLPKGGRHFTRSLAFNDQGQLFIAIGSTCDVCFEKHPWLATVIVTDAEGTTPRVFAQGLRNSVFIAIDPQTQDLWGTEMGRDFLGDLKPPDEINILQEGKDYGWPLCYGNKVHDTDFDKKAYIQIVPQPPCGITEPPVFEIAAHSAPLGLVFINSPQFPQEWQGDLLVAYHGSWNRSTPIGYKVARLNVEENKISGEEDFLTGFLTGSEAQGRPVDLAFDKAGSLYLSDDQAGIIYKISKD